MARTALASGSRSSRSTPSAEGDNVPAYRQSVALACGSAHRPPWGSPSDSYRYDRLRRSRLSTSQVSPRLAASPVGLHTQLTRAGRGRPMRYCKKCKSVQPGKFCADCGRSTKPQVGGMGPQTSFRDNLGVSHSGVGDIIVPNLGEVPARTERRDERVWVSGSAMKRVTGGLATVSAITGLVGFSFFDLTWDEATGSPWFLAVVAAVVVLVALPWLLVAVLRDEGFIRWSRGRILELRSGSVTSSLVTGPCKMHGCPGQLRLRRVKVGTKPVEKDGKTREVDDLDTRLVCSLNRKKHVFPFDHAYLDDP
jgi:hypothetical protein